MIEASRAIWKRQVKQTVPKAKLLSTLKLLNKKLTQASSILDEVIENLEIPITSVTIARNLKAAITSIQGSQLIEITMNKIANSNKMVIDERSSATWLIDWMENQITQVIILKQSLARR